MIGGETIIPMNVSGEAWVACFNTASQESCGGKWPVKIGGNYEYGAPFPMLSANGTTTGLCLPASGDPCFNLEGESVSTPANMTSVIGETEEWNGPGLTIGPRVYVPHAFSAGGEVVDCFDYSTGEGCANFPKKLENLELLYTVNPDPQRPTCIWVNADGGTDQIQDFDAYTGEACGGGTVRVLASQFVAPAPQCTPANYVSLQVLEPSRSSYTEGSVAFANGDGELIPGLPELTLDETGSASLNGLDLNTTTGLPQFLFTLKNPTGPVGSVKVRLTWEGNYDESCAGGGRTVTVPPPPPRPRGGGRGGDHHGCPGRVQTETGGRRAPLRERAHRQPHAGVHRERRLPRGGQRQGDRLRDVHARWPQDRDRHQVGPTRNVRDARTSCPWRETQADDPRDVYGGQSNRREKHQPYACPLRGVSSEAHPELHRLRAKGRHTDRAGD